MKLLLSVLKKKLFKKTIILSKLDVRIPVSNFDTFWKKINSA